MGRNVENNKEKVLLCSERGITLLALVLTVIVLLILAGVTINLTLGQNRHIHNSTNSSTKLYTGAKSRIGGNRQFN